MASGDRFYKLEFKNRPVLYGDIGSLLKIDGMVVGGGETHAILLLPSSTFGSTLWAPPIFKLTDEEWCDYIARADQPEILVGNPKVFHRKVRWEISGAVQQKIWVRDGLKCMYCKRKMGDVQLTIDHFIPLELGGENNQKNYLSACRKCNKSKGSQDPKDYCSTTLFNELSAYLYNLPS